jgi:hypothetical protein
VDEIAITPTTATATKSPERMSRGFQRTVIGPVSFSSKNPGRPAGWSHDAEPSGFARGAVQGGRCISEEIEIGVDGRRELRREAGMKGVARCDA